MRFRYLRKIVEKIQIVYWDIVPYDLRPGRLWYLLKCWLWYRYSTVKPRGLPHTWIDRCGLMPHMIFEILSNFIEKECGEDCHVVWYADELDDESGWVPHTVEVDGVQVNVRDEMQDLYDWWHKDYFVNIDHIYDKWHEHRDLHVKDIFTKVTDRDTVDWVKSVDSSYDEDEDDEDNYLKEWGSEYSSPEAEIENERLFNEANAKEEHYRTELNNRLHRVINVIPYMWT